LILLLECPFLETLALYWLPDLRSKVDFLSVMFVVIGGSTFFVNVFQSCIYAIMGERISYDFKMEAYNKIIRKPIKFFDYPINNSGILSATVSIGTQKVSNLASIVPRSDYSRDSVLYHLV